jgi:hypothetical protein
MIGDVPLITLQPALGQQAGLPEPVPIHQIGGRWINNSSAASSPRLGQLTRQLEKRDE